SVVDRTPAGRGLSWRPTCAMGAASSYSIACRCVAAEGAAESCATVRGPAFSSPSARLLNPPNLTLQQSRESKAGPRASRRRARTSLREPKQQSRPRLPVLAQIDRWCGEDERLTAPAASSDSDDALIRRVVEDRC